MKINAKTLHQLSSEIYGVHQRLETGQVTVIQKGFLDKNISGKARYILKKNLAEPVLKIQERIKEELKTIVEQSGMKEIEEKLNSLEESRKNDAENPVIRKEIESTKEALKEAARKADQMYDKFLDDIQDSMDEVELFPYSLFDLNGQNGFDGTERYDELSKFVDFEK